MKLIPRRRRLEAGVARIAAAGNGLLGGNPSVALRVRSNIAREMECGVWGDLPADAHSADDIVAVLAQLAADPDIRSEVGEVDPDFTHCHFAWLPSADAMIAVWDRCAGDEDAAQDSEPQTENDASTIRQMGASWPDDIQPLLEAEQRLDVGLRELRAIANMLGHAARSVRCREALDGN